MTRDEAEARVRRLAAEHPEREAHRWFARAESDGSWVVVKVPVPAGTRVDPLRGTVAAKPKPPQPDDPRTSVERDVGGNYA